MASNDPNSPGLIDQHGRKFALKGVDVRARLHGLMAKVEAQQSYLNPQATNIEVVYTFPLPIDAVLLSFEVEIAGKKLTGCVVERKRAERAYEDAVTDGHSAVMLQEAGPGLYTVSIGNVMAYETVIVRYRYSLMLSWQGARLRFLLPTTIAPRYGNALAAGLQPHQIPTSALDVEYPLNLVVTIEGSLASATVASPSHPLVVQRLDNGMAVRLSEKAVLDRDFVLTLESDSTQSACIQTHDGDEYVAVASLRIPPVQAAEAKPLALKVVIDCSGSMAGTGIAQARKAALEILNQLRPTDRFNVTLFGSDCQHFFSALVPANAHNITAAWRRLENVDADMGGTEMQEALESAFSINHADTQASVLLITDGEIYEYEKLVYCAENSGNRVFTVGVGSAVAEVFLQSLAGATGGACELVAPQEGMSDRILYQFHRLRQPRLESFRIVWPSTPEWTTTLPDTAFAGDTIHVFGGFKKPLKGELALHATVVDGEIDVEVAAVLCVEMDLPRIAASKRVATATREEGLKLSLAHQLLSKWTNYLVIAEREIEAAGLPGLHQVPQMLAAGWGGIGHIDLCLAQTRKNSPRVPHSHPSFDDCDFSGSDNDMDLSFEDLADDPDHATPAKFVARMEFEIDTDLPVINLPQNLVELAGWGLDEQWVTFLGGLVEHGHDEAKVVIAFVYALSESPVGHLFGRALKRVILRGWKDSAPDPLLTKFLVNLTKEIDTQDWSNALDYVFRVF